MKKLLVALLLWYPLSASALTYEWTDGGGTVNFTEDLGNVPKKYRKRVKVLGSDESGTPQIIENAEPATGKATVGGTPKEKKTSGGKESAALRSEYATAKASLQATEEELADLYGRLGDTSKMSRSEYLSLQNTVKQDEYRVVEQKKRLDRLLEKAEKAGVALD